VIRRARRRRPIAAAALLGLLLIVGGCTREGDQDTNEGGPGSDANVAVEVLVTDDELAMPDSVPAGLTVFEVTNNGTAEHGFAIEGHDEQLDQLAIDELATLEVELEPGTYTVYSPMPGDRDAGLERQLTVTERVSDEAPLQDDAVGPSEEQQEIDDP
jgi:hypothetical protein